MNKRFGKIHWNKIAKWRLWLGIAVALYLLSLINSNFLANNANYSRAKYSLERSLRKKEKVFYNIINDHHRIAQITDKIKDSSNSLSFDIQDLHIGLFVYKLNDIGNPLLIYWNNSNVDVNYSVLQKPNGCYLIEDNKGFFEQINYTIQLDSSTYRVVGLIPIYWQYPQTSNLLKSQFDGFPNMRLKYKIDNKGIPIINSRNQIIYHIAAIDGAQSAKLDNVSLILKIISLTILLVLVNGYARKVVYRYGFYRGLCFLLVVIFGGRILSYYFPFPFNFRVYELFDPLIYATTWLHRSLGDLIVNLILLWWLVNFVKNHLDHLIKDKFSQKLWQYKHPIAFAGLIILTYATIEFVRLIESLVVDSQVSFNVTNFFSMNQYTVVCFAALSIFMWCYIRICYLCIWTSRKLGYTYLRRTIIISITGIVIGIFYSNAHTILSDFITIAWLIVFVIVIDRNWIRFKKDFVASPAFLTMVLILSGSLTIVIYTEYRQLELMDRKFFAENLSMRSDETGEILLHMGINNFNTFFVQNGSSLLYKENQNEAAKSKIINDYFSGYLNRYQTSIYTFDSLHRPLFNEDSTGFETLQNNIQMLGKHMEIPDLYYNDSKPDQFSYIYRKKITSLFDSTIAYAFILVKPIRYSENQLDVRLFNTSKTLPGDIHDDYSYAIYYKNKLMTSYLNADYSGSIPKKNFIASNYILENNSNNSTLWYKASDNKIIVVVKKMNVLLDAMTLFAYIFCSAIIVLSISYICIYFVFSGFNIRYLKKIMRFTINRKMQATIIVLNLFSFLIVSISTITFFLAQFTETNKVKLSKYAHVVSLETENSIKNDLLQDIGDQDFVYEGNVNDVFVKKVLQIASLNNVDINYYNLDGTLAASTQPTIYGNGFFNTLMNPKSFYMLNNKDRLEYTNEEQIGNFKYSSIYFPLQDLQGNNIAYLNIPYLNSQNEVRQQISSFLVAIINLNALIFIFAGFIALRLTKQITTAFSIIEKKMKFLNLTGKNEPIVYKQSDEIGALVRGYNRMLQKLSESVEALSKSEREGAWQEMAKQVAHEIKNPLTPMKLSIQYLDKAIASGAPNTTELSKNVTNTLIVQIDQLAKIAGDFSQFANISQITPEKIHIQESIQSIVNLYNTDENIFLETDLPEKEIKIWADRIQINRLLTNLIKNAIEASSVTEKKTIKIKQTVHYNTTTIAIKDFGIGIPDSMKEKIFVPNFTTKSSGTGLGLAICKGICERAGGSISFESQVGQGTTFYIHFPILK